MHSVKNSDESKKQLIAGVNLVADAVKSTLGAKGRNVIISNEKNGYDITKDGVTVAKNINSDNHFENVGASIIKEVSMKTAKEAGDGTTSSTVIAQRLINDGFQNIEQQGGKINSIFLKRSLDEFASQINNYIKSNAIQMDSHESIKNIARISANNDTLLGDMIADAFEEVGKDGVISIEDSNTFDTYLEKVEGVEVGRGYESPYFVNDFERKMVNLENSLVLLYSGSVAGIEPFINLLKDVFQNGGGRPLVIIADEVEAKEALTTLVKNQIQGELKSLVIKAPEFGRYRSNMMDDLSIILNTKVIDPKAGMKLEDVRVKDLGRAQSVKSYHDRTIFVTEKVDNERLEQRVTYLQNELENTNLDNKTREHYYKRYAKLIGGVAVIYLGANSEIELKEKKYRVEDSIHATRSALEQGVCVGAGMALYRASRILEDILNKEGITINESYAAQMLKSAIEEPAKMIAENAGIDRDVFTKAIHENKKDSFGYNCVTNEYTDLVESGVIDPVKVVTSALTNAVSVAGMILTTEALIVNRRDNNEEQEHNQKLF